MQAEHSLHAIMLSRKEFLSMWITIRGKLHQTNCRNWHSITCQAPCLAAPWWLNSLGYLRPTYAIPSDYCQFFPWCKGWNSSLRPLRTPGQFILATVSTPRLLFSLPFYQAVPEARNSRDTICSVTSVVCFSLSNHQWLMWLFRVTQAWRVSSTGIAAHVC